MRKIKVFFWVVRSKLIFYLLEKYTHPEIIPLTVAGAFLVQSGDIAVINTPDGIDLGRVQSIEAPTVRIRLFRRPN